MIHNIVDYFVRKKVYLALLGFLLLVGGRPSFFPWLAPLAAIGGYCSLWLCIKEEPTNKRRFIVGWMSFFLTFLVSTSWLLSHPYSYIFAVWVLLSGLFSFPFALLSTACLKRPLTLFSIVGYALAFSLLEHSFTLIACGFPFLSSALYFTWLHSSLQLANLVGEGGLSFLVFATNLFFLRCFQQKRFPCIALSLVFMPYAVGGILLWKHQEAQRLFDQKTPPLRCAIIHMQEQPDVFCDIFDPEVRVPLEWGKVFALMERIAPGSVDLVVLPEGVVPYAAEAPLFTLKAGAPAISSLEVAQRTAEHLQAPLILGLEGRSFNEGRASFYNSCYFVPEDKTPPTRYDKQLLLPFGEYVPLKKLKNILASYGIHDSFSPGKRAVLFEKGPLRITPFICYEEIFAHYTKKALSLHPTCFVSISSDSWFPSKILAEEHFALARLRAVEAGKPLIRSCNMGVSSAIDATGNVVGRSEREPTCLVVSLSLYNK